MKIYRATLKHVDIERKFGFAYTEAGEKIYCSFFQLRAVALGSAGPYFEQVNRLAPETPNRGDVIVFTVDEEKPGRAKKWGSAMDWDGATMAFNHEQELERQRVAAAAIKKFGRGLNNSPVAPPRIARQPRGENFYLARQRENAQYTEA